MENGRCNGCSAARPNGNGGVAPPHVAMLATPGMGHLIPLAELAKRLAARHGATSTLLTFASTASATQREFLSSLPQGIQSVSLPRVDLSDLPADAAIETRMSEECVRLVPALTGILRGMRETTRLVAFVADLFGADSFDAARDAGVPRRYLFFPTNLHTLSLLLHLPELDVSIPGEFRDLADPVRLPGCVPIPGKDILMPLQDKSKACYKWMVHHGRRYCDADAILVNSFEAVEPDAAKALRHPKPGRPPVFPIGPLIQTHCADDAAPPSPRAACLGWLDRQPAKSVIFVSFGSGGALPTEHMRELALGLELSGQRFLWVVRSPSDEGEVSANYYDAETKKDPFSYLPEGFVERTKEAGLLVPSWAPQTKVLAHPATGGFLTHCGWNSVLESLVHGVPMVAWPLYAEQRQNAVLLADGVGAAIRVPEAKGKEKIAAAVRETMAGEGRGAAVRAKVAELQRMAAEGLRDGGAATSALDEVVNRWTGEE
ncbi:UDP-glycosyltransferase 72B3-like [Oryza brachyantha]|uniref:UDP-glycosyltransferase 72B3-like n=1 Tax=Oryza brachyantha TaxID=4533 RepID=UPI001ADB76BB|nr:UDP-glycosyltransferase 72B3-like [Oryza brachyantha]